MGDLRQAKSRPLSNYNYKRGRRGAIYSMALALDNQALHLILMAVSVKENTFGFVKLKIPVRKVVELDIHGRSAFIHNKTYGFLLGKAK